MPIKIHAHYDGKTIVPDEPVDLPSDQQLEVEVRVISAAHPPRSEAGMKPDITSLPFFGMWAARDDMQDSVEWVRKEREKWNSRLSGTD